MSKRADAAAAELKTLLAARDTVKSVFNAEPDSVITKRCGGDALVPGTWGIGNRVPCSKQAQRTGSLCDGQCEPTHYIEDAK